MANAEGEIFDLPGYAAMGMSGETTVPLITGDTINTPYGSEFMLLPDRNPVLFNLATKESEILWENPLEPGNPVFPVAVFNSPGYVNTHTSAYTEKDNAQNLPLFSYGAVGWQNGSFRSAAIRVDRERRQDLRLMKQEKIDNGIKRLQQSMPTNRLVRHLEKCALEYGCPAAKNFFLGRYEAPLPTSQRCNADCAGCISLQKDSDIINPQERIPFTPTPDEIAEVALEHIQSVNKSVVSFGQGCEGDPLLAAKEIHPAIEMIRATTSRGTINMNTNGSLPDVLKRLFDVGLDSIRISMNSTRKVCYNAYFQPKGYTFKDVERSIDLAVKKGKFVSINYLNIPGFTDSPEETESLLLFLKKHKINMIQWRNLNYDPVSYLNIMGSAATFGSPIGMKRLLEKVKNDFPSIKYGYFNPPREKFRP